MCVAPALVIHASTASGRRVVFSAPNFRDAHRWKAGERLEVTHRVCLQARSDTPISAASLNLRIHLLQIVACPADLTHPLKPNLPPPAAAAAAAAAAARARARALLVQLSPDEQLLAAVGREDGELRGGVALPQKVGGERRDKARLVRVAARLGLGLEGLGLGGLGLCVGLGARVGHGALP